MSKMTTKLRFGEEITIGDNIKLYRANGRDKLRIVIDTPIEVLIEKKVVKSGNETTRRVESEVDRRDRDKR